MADAPPTLPVDVPAAVPAPPVPAPGAVPLEIPTGSAETGRTKRSKAAVGASVAAVAALGLAGVFAVSRWTGGESVGGAATPEDLGAELMAAMEAEDVLGVIDTMLPGERETLGDPFVELVGELRRLDLLADDTDLSAIAGLDIEFTGEAVEIEPTNVPDIVDIHMTADALVTFDGAALPIGELIEGRLTPEQLAELRGTQLAESEPFDVTMTAVLDGDQWYFSLFHTLAEIARDEAGSPDIPASGVALVGGESPEAAVEGLFDRIERLDLAGIIGTLDPAEAAALQRYAPLFLDDAQSALAEVPLDWRIDRREYRVVGSGSERTVLIDAIGVSGSLDGSPFSVAFDGDCVRATLGDEQIEECGGATGDVTEMLGDEGSVGEFVVAVEDAFSDVEEVGLELRERDGEWYVSPIATGTEAMLRVLRALDRDELDRLIELGGSAFDEAFALFDDFDDDMVIDLDDDIVFDDGFDDQSDDGSDDGVDDDGVDDPSDDPSDDGSDAGSDDGSDGGDGSADPGIVVEDPTGQSAWERCYAPELAADASACFADAVASGELVESDVPAVLRYPECGVAEVLWSGGVYGLDDAAFVEVLAPAVDCFDALVASGAIEDWEVPFEVSYFPCFENRNWFTVYDDVEYNERVAACMDGSEGD